VEGVMIDPEDESAAVSPDSEARKVMGGR
jgi:hypothetical protein